ncbi:MAG TPA: hydroxymethylbilane synthase [Stellaceae bacterium]|nr:hydroxymethylbilane synthase [Stellaceae bacterium]
MSANHQPIRIGTRGSPLALVQARMVRDGLAAAHADLGGPDDIQVVPIKTTGDAVQDRKLMEIGGKGLFTKEIEEALLDGRIDCAVHSMKDMPTWLPAGLVIGAMLAREDARDALFAKTGKCIAELPRGTTVGTASLRRQAQLLALRPDLRVVPLRGNVETRLRKLAAGEADATLLAVAGLKRLGLLDKAAAIIDSGEILPAVGQGAIGVEMRADDARLRALLAPLDHRATTLCVTAERACLAELDGSCHTPIAAYAELAAAGGLRLRSLIALPDGTAVHRDERDGPAADPVALGRAAGQHLKAAAAPAFFKVASA